MRRTITTQKMDKHARLQALKKRGKQTTSTTAYKS